MAQPDLELNGKSWNRQSFIADLVVVGAVVEEVDVVGGMVVEVATPVHVYGMRRHLDF